jgi:hypothetical protein
MNSRIVTMGVVQALMNGWCRRYGRWNTNGAAVIFGQSRVARVTGKCRDHELGYLGSWKLCWVVRLHYLKDGENPLDGAADVIWRKGDKLDIQGFYLLGFGQMRWTTMPSLSVLLKQILFSHLHELRPPVSRNGKIYIILATDFVREAHVSYVNDRSLSREKMLPISSSWGRRSCFTAERFNIWKQQQVF